MKIHVLSDLHLEFRDWAFTPPKTDADVIVLAGDIHRGHHAIAWAERTFPDTPVVYVAGNHEFYHGHWDQTLDELRQAAHGTRVHFLEDRAVTIEGVRFVGATLWTDFSLYGADRADGFERVAEQTMNDFRLIHRSIDADNALDSLSDNAMPILGASDTVVRHKRSREYLAQTLALACEHPTVVVTHHLPSPRSVAPQYVGDDLNPAFASDLEDVVKTYQPQLWIHGHTHDSFDYRIEETRVVCNPRGYRVNGEAENPRFCSNFIVEI